MKKIIALVMLLCFTTITATAFENQIKKEITYETTIDHPDIVSINTIVFEQKGDWNIDYQTSKGFNLCGTQSGGYSYKIETSRYGENLDTYKQDNFHTYTTKVEARYSKNKQTERHYTGGMYLRRIQGNDRIAERNYIPITGDYNRKGNCSSGYKNPRMGEAIYLGWRNSTFVIGCQTNKL